MEHCTILPPKNGKNYSKVQLLSWARRAMENSYAPYSAAKREKRREGVVLRTENDSYGRGTRFELMNYKGPTAIEVAVGDLFARRPLERSGEVEHITEAYFFTEEVTDPKDPNTYVPRGEALEWLYMFGNEETQVHFGSLKDGSFATKKLVELLPYGEPLQGVEAFRKATASFGNFLRQNQKHPTGVTKGIWSSLREARLRAIAPYSTYRVGTVLEAYVPGDVLLEMIEELTQHFLEEGMKGDVFKEAQKQVLALRTMMGMNIEIDEGRAVLHGEPCALGQMVTNFGPKARIKRMHLQGGVDKGDPGCTPCGSCREFIGELAIDSEETTDPNAGTTEIIMVSETDVKMPVHPGALLPGAFQLNKP